MTLLLDVIWPNVPMMVKTHSTDVRGALILAFSLFSAGVPSLTPRETSEFAPKIKSPVTRAYGAKFGGVQLNKLRSRGRNRDIWTSQLSWWRPGAGPLWETERTKGQWRQPTTNTKLTYQQSIIKPFGAMTTKRPMPWLFLYRVHMTRCK